MKKNFIRIICLISIFALFIPTVLATDNEIKNPFENSRYYLEGKYSIHYRIFEAEGEEKGKVLMLHGFACSTKTWEPIAYNMVENGFTCVLVDLPGFGFSTRETEISDEEAIPREELVINLMKLIAPIEEWHVAGHSMGGGVAMNIACLEPEIKSLILVCPCPIAEQSSVMASIMTSEPMGKMANFIFEEMTKLTPVLRLVAYFAFMDWDYTQNYDLSVISTPLQVHNTGYSNMITSVRAMPNDFDKISRLNIPTVLVQADKDMILTSAMKDQVAQAFPDASYYNVVGGGHLCNENRADEISAFILNYI